MLLLVDSVVISDVLDVAVLEAGLSVISAVGAVLMVVDRDSAVVVDVDWVRVEDMVELVLLIDEVEVDVSVIVGVILLGAVLVESVVDSDMLELEGVLPDPACLDPQTVLKRMAPSRINRRPMTSPTTYSSSRSCMQSSSGSSSSNVYVAYISKTVFPKICTCLIRRFSSRRTFIFLGRFDDLRMI